MTTVVICLALVAISVLDSQVTGHVAVSLDKNWRGLYDILVTTNNQDFGASRTQGLVDGNFVATAGQGGISPEQLAEIRGISGVEVAAPIGMVGVLRDVALTPLLNVPDDPDAAESVLTSAISVARITSTLTVQAGGEDKTVSKSSGVVALTRRSSGEGGMGSQEPFPAISYPAGFGPQTTSSGYQIPLGLLPLFASSVIAIDPKAEQELLGRNGKFLTPLRAASTHRDTASNGHAWAKLVDAKKYLVQQTSIETATASKESKQVVPLVVNGSKPQRLSLTVAIARTDGISDLPSSPDALRKAADSATFTPWKTVSRDVSALAVPFTSPDLSLAWPGSTLPPDESGGSFYTQATELRPILVGRPSYSAPTGSLQGSKNPSYKLEPKGVRLPDGLEASPDVNKLWGLDGTAGSVQTYREAQEVSGQGFAQALPAPLGQFKTSDLDFGDASNASYVPSGIYDPNQTMLVGNPDGSTVSSKEVVEPNLSQLDFITRAPGAITDLIGGEALRGDNPIDAIRVRVSGITSYSTASRNQILKIAGAIAAMGLKASVVAGSSPQRVNVYVPDYYVGKDSPATDLGWVQQDWTTLGASVTVTAAMTSLQYDLIYSALFILVAALIAVTRTTGRRRRAEALLLRELGWTVSQVRRRMIALQMPGVALIFLTSIMAFALKPSNFIVGSLPGIVLTLAALAAAAVGVGVSWKSDAHTPTKGRSGAPLSSVRAMAWRHLVSSRGSYGAQLLGLVTLGLSVGLTFDILATGIEQSGRTRLASVVIDSTAVSTALLGFTAAAAALVLSYLGRTSDLHQQSDEAHTLRAMGFSRRSVRSLRFFQTAILAASALIAGAIVLFAMAAVSGSGLVPVLVGLAAIAGGSCILVLSARSGKVE